MVVYLSPSHISLFRHLNYSCGWCQPGAWVMMQGPRATVLSCLEFNHNHLSSLQYPQPPALSQDRSFSIKLYMHMKRITNEKQPVQHWHRSRDADVSTYTSYFSSAASRFTPHAAGRPGQVLGRSAGRRDKTLTEYLAKRSQQISRIQTQAEF